MKALKNINWVIAISLLCLSACQKEEYSLDALPDKSQISYEVVQDLSVDPGGNTVILINKTPDAMAVWDFGSGKSYRDRDTVRFAFQGDYVIKFSAMTGGGLVEADPKTIKVTKDELKYVNHPLWNLLTGGGAGFEKTWVLDVNANGDKKMFTSPVYFAGTDVAYGTVATDGSKVEWKQECPAGKTNCWTYAPNYTTDTWAADKKDYGSMTFSLKGGAVFKSNHNGVSNLGNETGGFFLDVNTLTLTTSNASPIGVNFTHSDVASIYTWKVISLTENSMQLAGKHKSKDEVQVLNFISKAYSDAWVPSAPPAPVADAGFNPKFAAGGLLDYLTASSARVWKMDAEGNPVDWIASGKGWTVDYTSTAGWGWDPASWSAALDNSYIKFEKSGMKYTRFQNGVKTTGTFSIDAANNEVTLTGNTLLQNPSSWMNSTQTKLKVIKAFPDDLSKGVWFGVSYDTSKDEWYSLHYILF